MVKKTIISLKNLPTNVKCTPCKKEKIFLNLFDVWLWSYYILFFCDVFSIDMVDLGDK